MTEDLFPGFETRIFDTGAARIYARIGGSGPPLVLLHGYPQSHVCWHRIAPKLAEHFTLILPDLRGYGESSCPADEPGHFAYSKRAMAVDVIAMMDELEHETFRLVGHDRGARVAYRLALDFPDRLDRLGILDIVPTYDVWTRISPALAHKTYHWMFLARPHPLPERLIGNDADFYAETTLASWSQSGDLSAFGEQALACYRANYADPARLHAMCEDYRAGATCDFDADRRDRDAGVKITCPVHVIYGNGGFPELAGDPLEIWRGWAETVSGAGIDAGHFAHEENPAALLDALMPFLLHDEP